VPMEVRQVSTQAWSKVRDGGGEAQDLRRVVTNADTVIAIGTQGKTTGFLVYRTVGGRQKIVAMGPPQLLRNVP
jgi:hypothetical protein